jgi:hypothetical protein
VTANSFDRLGIRRRDVAAAVVATVGLGLWGGIILADEPVDVSGKLAWVPYTQPDGKQVPDEYETAAALTVPKHLNTLELRLALVNDYPNAGPCASAAYKVQWIGSEEPGQPVSSGTAVDVAVPSGVSVMEMLVLVDPGSGECILSLHTESARFINR